MKLWKEQDVFNVFTHYDKQNGQELIFENVLKVSETSTRAS